MQRIQNRNCFSVESRFFQQPYMGKQICSNYRGKITVFGWRREVKFPSKHREFQNSESSRNWGSTVLYRSLWTTIKRDGLKNPSLAQQEVACTGHRISCRLFVKGSRLTHELQCPVLEDETLINGLLKVWFIMFIMLKRRRRLKRRLCSSFTTHFSMRSHRNRIRISSWFLSMSFRFYIILYLSFARKKMYNFIAFSISNV